MRITDLGFAILMLIGVLVGFVAVWIRDK